MKYQETETVELKKSTSELKESVISIVAMLNKHQRGEVIFGVRNDGAVMSPIKPFVMYQRRLPIISSQRYTPLLNRWRLTVNSVLR